MSVTTAQHSIGFSRPPETRAELHAIVEYLWGVRFPEQAVCPGHTAPFDVFAAAYFNEQPIQVWKASRGFGGKSTMLAVLSATEAYFGKAQSTVLGGSASQSIRVQEVIQEAFLGDHAPPDVLAKDPTRYETVLANGGWVRALMASQRSVRGPHPQKLRMDEIDEMELGILEAALGQPMDDLKKGLPAHTVMSSTHQYAEGTMTTIMKRAAEQGWPVLEWCYRENMIENGGFLTPPEITAKRNLVPKHMWDAEYDLQEPSFEGRAIDSAKVDAMFVAKRGKYLGQAGRYLEIIEPRQNHEYVTGVDWAKEQDWTVIATWRADTSPWELAAWERVNRMPWPIMVDRLRHRLEKYGGVCAHDATGIGNVVADYLTVDDIDAKPVYNVVLTPRVRSQLFSDFVAAVEDDAMRAPRIEFAYGEHKYATVDDLFGSASKGHPPDSVVANALAWYLRDRVGKGVEPPVVDDLTKESYWSGLDV